MNTTGVSSESAFLEEPNRNFIELGGGGDRYELWLPIMANKSMCLELSRFNCMDCQYITQQSKMCNLWQFIPECFEVAYEAAWIIIYRIVVHSYEKIVMRPKMLFMTLVLWSPVTLMHQKQKEKR